MIETHFDIFTLFKFLESFTKIPIFVSSFFSLFRMRNVSQVLQQQKTYVCVSFRQMPLKLTNWAIIKHQKEMKYRRTATKGATINKPQRLRTATLSLKIVFIRVVNPRLWVYVCVCYMDIASTLQPYTMPDSYLFREHFLSSLSICLGNFFSSSSFCSILFCCAQISICSRYLPSETN